MANAVLDPDMDGFTTSLENATEELDPDQANSISDLIGDSSEETPSTPSVGSGNTPVVNGWFYTESMGWLFTNSTIYPYVLRKNLTNEGGGWLYFDESSTSPLKFWNFSTNVWEEH